MPPDDDLQALQAQIAAQKAQAGLTEKPIQVTQAATNMQTGIKAGTEFVGSLLGGGLLGWLIDGWLDSAPIGLIAGVLVGIVVAFWNLYKMTLPQPPSTGLQ